MTAISNKPQTLSSRAEALAARIEQGADELAVFAEGLTAEEWRRPLSLIGSDTRTIGVIVHHVASMYPIEVDLVRAIAGGNAVTDLTWAVVADINAKHAKDYATVTKTEALDLLRRNSREAANAVRQFTDQQLDTAAPLSLNYGAPVTAQFVIEDHPLRHSWHHLARIRKSLGR